jgi:hypothetical protein
MSGGMFGKSAPPLFPLLILKEDVLDTHLEPFLPDDVVSTVRRPLLLAPTLETLKESVRRDSESTSGEDTACLLLASVADIFGSDTGVLLADVVIFPLSFL